MANNLLIPTSTQITGEGPSVASILYGLDNSIPTITQTKQDRLTQRTLSKQQRLAEGSGFDSAILDRLTDADSPFIRGEQYGDRSIGLDAYEVAHDGEASADYLTSKSGLAKMARQREQLAMDKVVPVADITDEQVRIAGMQQRFDLLAALNVNRDGTMQKDLITPAVTTDSSVFGATNNPLGLDVIRRDSGNVGYYGKRKLTDVASLEGTTARDVIGEKAILDAYGNSFTPRPTASVPDIALNEPKEDGFFDSVIRAPQAFLAGGGKSAYDVADTAVELTGRLAGDTIGLVNEEAGNKVDKFLDLGTGDEKTAVVNSMLGYDDSHNKQAMANSGKHVEKAIKDVELFSPSTWGKLKGGELVDAAKDAFSSPEAAAYSLGYMGVALLGVAEKGAMKLFGGALKTHADDVAKIAKRSMSTTRKKKYVKALEKRLPPADKVKLFVAKNADAGLYGVTMNNDQMDDWVKENGGEKPTYLRIGLGATLNAIGMKADMGSAKFAIKDSKDLGHVVEKVFKGTAESEARKVLAKAAEYTARLTAAGMSEFPQEYMQSYIEAFNKVYGTDDRSLGETLSDPALRLKATQGAVAGAAGGVHMAGGSALVTDAAPALVTKGIPAAAKVVGSGLGKTLDVADSIITKDTSTGTEEIQAANPDIDPTVIRKVHEEAKAPNVDLNSPSSSDNTGEGIAPVEEVDHRAIAAVAADEAITNPVAQIQDEVDSKAVDEAATEFDTVYSEVLADLVEGAAIPEDQREGMGLPKDGEEYAKVFNSAVTNSLDELLTAASKLEKAGAGANKLNAMSNRIASLVKMETAKNSADVKKVLNDAGTEQSVKVRAILGSSAITHSDIDDYIASNAEALTPQETKLLEAKSEILKTTKMVGTEKIQGGGTLPGVNQWMAVLGQNDKLDTIARSKVSNFISGQASKLKTFKSSLDKWDRANKMPWTKDGAENTDFKLHLDYSSSKAKAEARSHAIRSNTIETTNNPDVVEYGDSSFNDVHSIADMTDTLTTESVAMGKLKDAFDVSLGAQKQPSKERTNTTGKSTPTEVVTPPVETMEDKATRGAAFKEFTQDEQKSLLYSVFAKSMAKESLTKVETVVTQDKEFGKAYEKFVASKATESSVEVPTSPSSDKKAEVPAEVVEAPVEASISQEESADLTEDDAAELQRMHEEDLAIKTKEVAKTTEGLEVQDGPGWGTTDVDTGMGNEEEQYFGDGTTVVNTRQKVTGVPKVNDSTIAELDKSINDLDKMSTTLLASIPKALQAILKGKC